MVVSSLLELELFLALMTKPILNTLERATETEKIEIIQVRALVSLEVSCGYFYLFLFFFKEQILMPRQKKLKKLLLPWLAVEGFLKLQTS